MFLLQPALAEDTAPWKIAIIGDTHDSPKRMEGSEGVAVNFIKTLYGEILKHNVDIVVQVGDMADIEGSAPVKGLAKRKELNKILREKGIPFYAVRGNHESLPFRAEQFRELFLPTRKQGAKGLATRKLNYGIRHKNASLYFMDIDLTPDQLVDFSAWVKRNRSKANTVPKHCLVFTHRTPADAHAIPGMPVGPLQRQRGGTAKHLLPQPPGCRSALRRHRTSARP